MNKDKEKSFSIKNVEVNTVNKNTFKILPH